MSYPDPTVTGSIGGLQPPQKLKPKTVSKATVPQPHPMQKGTKSK